MRKIGRMQEFLLSRPSPLVAGPLLGLCVVAMFATLNSRLGVVGGFSDLVERISERSLRIGWPGSFLLGLVGGAVVFTLLSGGGRATDGYGWLTRAFSGPTTVVLLVAGGILIGFGTKLAGGCTSGNGLCGTALGSRASLVATVTFFGTAVLVSLVTAAIFGAHV